MDFSKFKRILSLKNISLILVLVIIFVSLPSPSLAEFNPLQWGLNMAGGVLSTAPVLLIAAVFAVSLSFSFAFAWTSGALLTWITSPGFFSWGYTQNPVVEAGLNITKHFVNLGLVVVLVFIALAISLRLKEYATQKTLARLIIVALLVNFAPILVGLIVDASNIVMNYFLAGIKDRVTGILTGLLEKENALGLASDILKLTFGVLTEKLSILVKAAILTSLYFFIGLAFFLLFFIFLFRYIAIWLLTILSPLAFVALILPATKKFWDKWWEQLIQWSIIGIPMAFFLYLAIAVFGALSAKFQAKITFLGILGLDKDIAGLLDRIFPYYLVLALLYLGFFIGLQTSAMGAKAVISGIKRGYKAGGKVMVKKGVAATVRASENVKRTASRISERMKGSYRIAKQQGFTGGYAATQEAVRREWHRARRRTKVKIERKKREIETEGILKVGGREGLKAAKIGWAISKGALSTAKDVARAGWTAAMKPPKKRKLTGEEKEKIKRGEEVEIPEEPKE